MVNRPDCYACRFRVAVPGDAHSECRHPAATLINGIGFLAHALSRENPKEDRDHIMDAPEHDGAPGMRVAFRAEGVRNGWCTWPLNFDPAWLTECTGFALPVAEEEDA